MSKVQVDKVVNLSDDGAPQLTYGAELPVGYGLTGAGGLNISGVVTAASAVFSGNVTIGGTLTYEDVTNIDVVGVSTFAGRMNVNSTINANEGIKVIGVSTLAAVTGTTGTFSGAVSGTTGTFSGDVDIADKIVHTGDTNTAIRFPSADTFTVETGGSERLRVDSSGNIGIGTASASERLEVYPDANRALILRDKASTTYGMEIFNNSGNTSGEIHLTAASAGSVVINRSGSETARFNGSGQLLIGTTTEGHASADDLTVAGTADVGITVRSGDDDNGSLFFSDGTSGADEYRGWIQYTHTSNYLTFATNAGERVRINQYGMMGLSVTSPDALLSVLAQNSNTPPFVIQNPDADENFTIATYHDGNGMYGTIGVNYKLDSGGNGAVDTTDHRTAGIMFDGRNNGAIMFETNDAGSQPAERMRLDSSGRLLLGQTSADTDMGSNLQVAGSSYAASGILQARTTADGNGPALDFIKSRNATWGSHTIVQNGDELGRIYFRGDDGVNYSGAAAAIFGEIDGTPGADDLPGRLVFYTSADGADSPTERLRITNNGTASHYGGSSWASATTNGDFAITVSNLTDNGGNNWRKCGVYVQYSGINADATSSRSAVGYFGIGSVTTWNWFATDEDDVFTADTLPATLDNSTATSFRLNFNVADNNTGSVTVFVNGYSTKPVISIAG